MRVGKAGAMQRVVARKMIDQRARIGAAQVKFQKGGVWMGLEITAHCLMMLMPLL